jgi:hypothetical protein
MNFEADTEWFVLKGEERFGPFAYPDLVRMMQQKVIFSFDFAWHSGLSGWKRLSDIVEFQETSIRTFLADKKNGKGVITERKHERVPHSGRVIVHDQTVWWDAQASSISAGGVKLMIKNSMLIPGQTINLHFKSHGQFPAFNASGEVASKKYLEAVKDPAAPIEYGVRFLNVSGTGKDKLLEMLKDVA